MAAEVPIWLDCDTGHDDSFAILLAAYHPNAKLLGISTVFGNAPLANTTYNTLAILKAIGQEHVPVYAGSAEPFCRESAHAADIHGETGLDGTTCLPVPTARACDDMTAVRAMYTALSQTRKGSAWLVATGCLTNVALLFAIYPEIADHIAGLSAMGGAVGGNFTSAVLGTVAGHGTRFGNWTAWSEFNIYIDPESAKAVFSNSKLNHKTTLITLDLTHQFLATKDIQQELLHGPSTPTGPPSTIRKLFFEILTFFAKTYADIFGLRDGPPLHDPLAVAVALAPALFDRGLSERFEVSVITDGAHGSSATIRNGDSQCGRTVVKQVSGLRPEGVFIPRTMQHDELWQMLEDALTQAEAKVQSST